MRRSRLNITISDLVTAAKCEQQAVFDARYGKKRSRAWRRRAASGSRMHREYEFLTALGRKPRDPRCFIATEIYGANSIETEVLRRWRDARLRRRFVGRMLVRVYYSVSPALTPLISRSRLARSIARSLLKRLIDRIEPLS